MFRPPGADFEFSKALTVWPPRPSRARTHRPAVHGAGGPPLQSDRAGRWRPHMPPPHRSDSRASSPSPGRQLGRSPAVTGPNVCPQCERPARQAPTGPESRPGAESAAQVGSRVSGFLRVLAAAPRVILDEPGYETAAVEDRLLARLRLADDVKLLAELDAAVFRSPTGTGRP